jgi:hypothetical protein
MPAIGQAIESEIAGKNFRERSKAAFVKQPIDQRAKRREKLLV